MTTRTPLTDSKIANLTGVPGREMREPDAVEHLYLTITRSGGKCWQFRYWFGGKKYTLSFGSYPFIPIEGGYHVSRGSVTHGARDLARQARSYLDRGIDPRKHFDKGEFREAPKTKHATASVNTLEYVTRSWFRDKSPRWTPLHARNVLRRMEMHVFPRLGMRELASIEPLEFLEVLRVIETAGNNETAWRVLGILRMVFRYARVMRIVDQDPVAGLSEFLHPVQHQVLPAITEPEAAGGLMRDIHGYTGHPVTRAAMYLTALTFVRSSELRGALWCEFDLDKATWVIPASRMKMRIEHVVPLSKQAIQHLSELKLHSGNSPYVFPSQRDLNKPLNNNGILEGLRKMGYPKKSMCGHGFRAMARTLLAEVGVLSDYIEPQLAHTVPDANKTSYNRTKFLLARRNMMQIWSDYLDHLRIGREPGAFRVRVVEQEPEFLVAA